MTDNAADEVLFRIRQNIDGVTESTLREIFAPGQSASEYIELQNVLDALVRIGLVKRLIVTGSIRYIASSSIQK